MVLEERRCVKERHGSLINEFSRLPGARGRGHELYGLMRGCRTMGIGEAGSQRMTSRVPLDWFRHKRGLGNRVDRERLRTSVSVPFRASRVSTSMSYERGTSTQVRHCPAVRFINCHNGLQRDPHRGIRIVLVAP